MLWPRLPTNTNSARDLGSAPDPLTGLRPEPLGTKSHVDPLERRVDRQSVCNHDAGL